MRIILTLLLVLMVAAVIGCGSPQAQPTAAAVAASTPVSEPPTQVAPVVDEHVFYQLFWLDIHVLTIYRGSGSLRSEEGNNPADVFSGACSYMSAISHYFEHEAILRALVDRADSLENFFAVLEAEGEYEVREQQLDAGY